MTKMVKCLLFVNIRMKEHVTERQIKSSIRHFINVQVLVLKKPIMEILRLLSNFQSEMKMLQGCLYCFRQKMFMKRLKHWLMDYLTSLVQLAALLDYSLDFHFTDIYPCHCKGSLTIRFSSNTLYHLHIKKV